MARIAFVLIDPFADWEPALLAANAKSELGDEVRWLTPGGREVRSMGGLTVKADVCLQSNLNCLPTAGAAEQPDTLDCGETLVDGCQIVVTVEFPYQAHPIFPSVLGLAMPTTLQGRAHALLDGRSMSSTL